MLPVALLGWLLALAAGAWAWTLRARVLDAEARHDALVTRTRTALGEAEASVRRVREEAERTRPFAAEPVLRDLVDLVDDLDRALLAGIDAPGVAMIHRQSVDLLRRHGAERFDCLDAEFDPAAHEAVAVEPSPGPANRVTREVAAGYRFRGRLLRAARVVVTRSED